VTPDPALDDLLNAAAVIINNARQGPTCYYQYPARTPHTLGSDPSCALCVLASAVRVYTDVTP